MPAMSYGTNINKFIPSHTNHSRMKIILYSLVQVLESGRRSWEGGRGREREGVRERRRGREGAQAIIWDEIAPPWLARHP